MKSHKDFGEWTNRVGFSRLLTAGQYSKTREEKPGKSFGNWRAQLFRQRVRNESRHAALAWLLDSNSRSSNPLEAWLSRVTSLPVTLFLSLKKKKPNERKVKPPNRTEALQPLQKQVTAAGSKLLLLGKSSAALCTENEEQETPRGKQVWGCSKWG